MSNSSLLQADGLFNAGKYAEARALYDQIHAHASDDGTRAECRAMIARSFLITDQKEEGRLWLERSRQLAAPEEPTGWSRYLGVRGRFEWKDGRISEALETFRQAYEFCHLHKLHERAVDAAHMIAILVPPADQVEWAKRGIAEAEAGAPRWLGPLWNNLGSTYEDLGQYADALAAYQNARIHHQQHGTPSNRARAEWAVGHAYRVGGDFDEAERILAPLLASFAELEDTEFIGWTHEELAQCRAARRDAPGARAHFSDALSALDNAGIQQWDPNARKRITDAIARLGGDGAPDMPAPPA